MYGGLWAASKPTLQYMVLLVQGKVRNTTEVHLTPNLLLGTAVDTQLTIRANVAWQGLNFGGGHPHPQGMRVAETSAAVVPQGYNKDP